MKRGDAVLLRGGLPGASKFVADVARAPRLLPLPREDAHPQLPVGQLGLLAVVSGRPSARQAAW